MDPIANERSQRSGHPLLWAIFLGVSWTWVIGMFLPVLLVRDHGTWGWIMFAVPNVIGAAAMGWVLRDAGTSKAFVERHAVACRAFSLITIAYHVFFAMWMLQRLHGKGLHVWGFIAIGASLVAAVGMFNNVMRWFAAIFAMFASSVMWWLLHQQQSLLRVPDLLPLHENASIWKATCLLPSFIVGFALCPYLDLTFHRARQQTTPAGGRLAFGVGFGVVFFSMIVFTLLYARWLVRAVDGHQLGQTSTLFLLFHLVIQSALTVGAHIRELTPRDGRRRVDVVGIAFILIMFAVGWYASSPRTIRGHDFGELVYWCLLGFYGIVFPAYLLTGRLLLVMLAVILVLPMYWIGYVEGQPVWLLPGTLVLLLLRPLAKRMQANSP